MSAGRIVLAGGGFPARDTHATMFVEVMKYVVAGCVVALRMQKAVVRSPAWRLELLQPNGLTPLCVKPDEGSNGGDLERTWSNQQVDDVINLDGFDLGRPD